MPKDNRFDGIHERIDSLSAELALTRKDVAEHRQENTSAAKVNVAPSKNESWIKKYSGWFTAAALVFGSGIILKVADGWIDSRIGLSMKEPSEKIVAQGQSLSEIKGQLKEISGLLHIVVQKQMKTVAMLPQAEFNVRLAEVKTVLAIAKSQDVKAPDERVAESIRSKVADSDEDLDQYWGAAAAVINYESPPLTPSLPDCLDSFPTTKRIPDALVWGTKKMTITQPFTYSHCRIELDDPRAGQLYAQTLSRGTLRFYDCLIRYRGRQVSVPATQHGLFGELRFINCVFDLDLPVGRPPKLGEQLIAQAISSRSISDIALTLRF